MRTIDGVVYWEYAAADFYQCYAGNEFKLCQPAKAGLPPTDPMTEGMSDCRCAPEEPECFARPGPGGDFRTTQVLDWNGDGLDDIVQVHSQTRELMVYVKQGNKPDLLTEVVDGLGGRTRVSHRPVSDPAVYTPSSDCTYPFDCLKRGLWVVSKIALDGGAASPGAPIEHDYSYADGRTDKLGRGWLGFKERRARREVVPSPTNGNARFVEESVKRFDRAFEIDGQNLPYRGLPTYEITRVTGTSNGVHAARQRWFTYPAVARGVPGAPPGENGKVYRLGPPQVVEEEFENTHDDPLDGASRRLVSTAVEVDEYGNEARREVLTRWLPVEGEEEVLNHLVVTTAYDDLPATTFSERRFLGLPTERSLTSVQGEHSVTRRATYDYDVATASLRSVTEAPQGGADLEQTTRYVRDPGTGVVIEVEEKDTLGQARRTLMTYDAEGLYPEVVTNAEGHVTRTFYWPAFDAPVWTRDGNGIVTRRRYDGLGRLRATDGPSGADATVSYASEPGLPVVVTSTGPDGSASATGIDSLGRDGVLRARAMSGIWLETRVRYDDLGRVAEVRRPTGVTTFEYDDFGRVTREVKSDENAPQTAAVEYTRDDFFKTTTIDEVGRVSTVVVDGMGRVVQKVEDGGESGGLTSDYVYGAFGDLVSATTGPPGDQSETTMEYDVLGRRTRLVAPDTGTTMTFYNAFGEVRREEDAEQRVMELVRDRLGRVTERNDSAAGYSGRTTFGFDTAPYGLGKPSGSSSPDGVQTELAYDAVFGQAEKEDLVVAGRRYETGMSYDSMGRVSARGYPEKLGAADAGRFRIKYGYASNGALASASDERTGKVYWSMREDHQAEELGFRRTRTDTFGNGAETRREYAPQTGRLLRLETAAPAVHQDSTYTYWPDGNLRRRQDATGSTTVHTAFGYDNLGRLTDWHTTDSQGTDSSAAGWRVKYGYDERGNLLGRTVSGAASPAQAVTQEYRGTGNAGPHAVTGSSLWVDSQGQRLPFGYDRVGNMTRHPQAGTIEYTPFNLPRRITNGQGATAAREFLYDAYGGRVVKRAVGGGSPSTVYVGDLYEERTDGNDKTHVFLVASGERVVAQLVRRGTEAAAEEVYIYADPLGTTEVTHTSTGTVTRSARDPFGNRVAVGAWGPADVRLAAGAPGAALPGEVTVGFTGHEHDDELGLVNMRGRIYDARLGRFLQADPFVQAPYFSQSHNRYSYVWNNPMRYLDPTGLCVTYTTAGGAQITHDCEGDPGDSTIRVFDDPIDWETEQMNREWEEYFLRYGMPGGERSVGVGLPRLWRSDFDYRALVAWATGEGNRLRMTFDYDLASKANQAALSEYGKSVALDLVFQAATLYGGTAKALAGTGTRIVELGALRIGSKAAGGAANSAANAPRLAKQLASQAGAAELRAGGGRAIAGAGTKRAIDDLPRLINQYGGGAADWSKVSSQASRFADGTLIEVHGYRNLSTGRLFELKSKVGTWSP